MSAYQDISASDLLNMMAAQPVLLVDVRNGDEVARGIIPGAIHIPLAALPGEYDALSKAGNIVFYCHSGVRSAHAADFASGKGCKNVFNLSGGVLAWARAGNTFAAKNEGENK